MSEVMGKVGGFRWTKSSILLVTLAIVIVADQVTKQFVHARFALHESLPVIEGLFSFTYIRNTGAAFGMLAQADPAFRVPFFLAVPVIALVAIGMVYRKLASEDRVPALGLALVMAGAIGNFIDRAIYGFVIDFLDFHWRNQAHFPAFNIADSAITVGVGILLLTGTPVAGDEEGKA